MGKIDQATVRELEWMALQASTTDAEYLWSKVFGGEVFKAFSNNERTEIRRRLEAIDGFIPSLGTFFQNVDYLELLADCAERPTSGKLEKAVSAHLQLISTGVKQEDSRVKAQVGEDSFMWSGAPALIRLIPGAADLGLRLSRHTEG